MASASPPVRSIRPAVAELARRYRAGELAYEQFLRLLPRGADRQDEEIAELLDLIVHEPKRGGPCGASDEEYGRIAGRMEELIAQLAATGR
jgi:hypothetical protein